MGHRAEQPAGYIKRLVLRSGCQTFFSMTPPFDLLTRRTPACSSARQEGPSTEDPRLAELRQAGVPYWSVPNPKLQPTRKASRL